MAVDYFTQGIPDKLANRADQYDEEDIWDLAQYVQTQYSKLKHRGVKIFENNYTNDHLGIMHLTSHNSAVSENQNGSGLLYVINNEYQECQLHDVPSKTWNEMTFFP